jgi:signal transduction histidine kinase
MSTASDNNIASPNEQLAALQQQLAQTQKLAVLGELLSTTTHEFNNVLMTILNYARMGLRHKDEATRDKALEKILAASQRAAKITSSILAAARNRSGNFEPTSLRQIVEDSLVLLERELVKFRIAVELDLADVPDALAAGNQIQQVLLNLLINARQAMPTGGRILIRLDYDSAGDMVDLVVRDTGAGIPADKLPRIFEPFFTTKGGPDETGKGGTGLGLSACRQIVEAHRGRIRVESTVGKGTQFTIKLPAVRKEAPRDTTPAAAFTAAVVAPPLEAAAQTAGRVLAPGHSLPQTAKTTLR